MVWGGGKRVEKRKKRPSCIQRRRGAFVYAVTLMLTITILKNIITIVIIIRQIRVNCDMAQTNHWILGRVTILL